MITYNGEIYTSRIEDGALQKGYNFKSQTDTEVVLYSFIEWGVNCLNKFNGMFAFAIWDNIENKLFIARDRYGIKPLYYSYKSSTFYFASEQKAIEKSHGFVSEVDVFALYEYLTFQNIFTNNTLKAHKITPSRSFSELMSTGDFKLNQYWILTLNQLISI